MRTQSRKPNALISFENRHLSTRTLRRVARSVADSANEIARRMIAFFLICTIVPLGIGTVYGQEAPGAHPRYSQLNYEQVDQLVAPIALYPDALVAQVLAAATYSTQIVEADRFIGQNRSLPPEELAKMVDSQPWDPSVKSLTAFPNVLANLDRNLSWTSKLGDAYYNQPQDVMNAVQRMRQRAYAAGTLRPTPQQAVVYQPNNIVIQPVNPAVVYVPVYNPWFAYGAPVPIYPAYYYVAPPSRPGMAVGVAFTAGVFVGAFAHFGWGWGYWRCGWGPHPVVVFHRTTYVSRSVTVIHHGYYGGYDHTVAARSYNQRVAYGPRGGVYTDQRTIGNGQYTNMRTATGPRGATYSDQRTVSNGQYSNTRTATGRHGATYTDQRTAGNGQYSNTRTATGPNGKTISTSTSRNSDGNSASITGPNGKTHTRTVTGRGTGDATITRTGPNGSKTRTRHRR